MTSYATERAYVHKHHTHLFEQRDVDEVASLVAHGKLREPEERHQAVGLGAERAELLEAHRQLAVRVVVQALSQAQR